MVAIKTILVPTDFSDTANAAVRCAAALAETLGSRLILLHVVEDVVAKGLTAGIGASAVRRLQDEATKEAADKLDRALAEPPLNRTGVDRAVVAGDPFAGILSYADEHHVDLIVLGTNGRTGIAHMLLGSVAERVVRTSPCPVLTVRTCQHGFVVA
jgi:nucleotide-binding universal stress UspA family protein